jgi:polyisoprenoid-binding protein YceI
VGKTDFRMINTKSIDNPDAKRKEHLKHSYFFDVEKDKQKKDPVKRYELFGVLNMNSFSRWLKLNFEFVRKTLVKTGLFIKW